jgi:hypothetical protein
MPDFAIPQDLPVAITNEAELAVAHQLARLIDADEPPGMAAAMLAVAVIDFVRDRDSPTAAFLAGVIYGLRKEFPRHA